jgi:hypothetical protein
MDRVGKNMYSNPNPRSKKCAPDADKKMHSLLHTDDVVESLVVGFLSSKQGFHEKSMRTLEQWMGWVHSIFAERIVHYKRVVWTDD